MITRKNIEALRANVIARMEELKEDLVAEKGLFAQDQLKTSLYNARALLLELDETARANDLSMEVEEKRSAHFDTWERLMTEQNRHLADIAAALRASAYGR